MGSGRLRQHLGALSSERSEGGGGVPSHKPAGSAPPSQSLSARQSIFVMPDSAAPVVRRPVRRLPSSGKEVLEAGKEFRRLSLGEASRGSSVEKEAGVGNNRVLVRRSAKVKKETALQRLMRDDDLPPPFPVSSSHVAAAPADEKPTKAPPAAPVKSRRRVAKTCVSFPSSIVPPTMIVNISAFHTFVKGGGFCKLWRRRRR